MITRVVQMKKKSDKLSAQMQELIKSMSKIIAKLSDPEETIPPPIEAARESLANGAVRANLTARARHFDKHSRMNYGYPYTPTDKKGWNAASLLNGTEQDECGRWSWMKLGQ